MPSRPPGGWNLRVHERAAQHSGPGYQLPHVYPLERLVWAQVDGMSCCRSAPLSDAKAICADDGLESEIDSDARMRGADLAHHHWTPKPCAAKCHRLSDSVSRERHSAHVSRGDLSYLGLTGYNSNARQRIFEPASCESDSVTNSCRIDGEEHVKKPLPPGMNMNHQHWEQETRKTRTTGKLENSRGRR